MSLAVLMPKASPEPTAVGLRLKLTRQSLGWSQRLLARQSGVDRGWISLVETGEIAQPGNDRLEQVARALRVTTDYLWHGAEGEITMRVDPDAMADAQEFSAWPKWAREIALAAGRAARGFYPIDQVPDEEAGDPGDDEPDE